MGSECAAGMILICSWTIIADTEAARIVVGVLPTTPSRTLKNGWSVGIKQKPPFDDWEPQSLVRRMDPSSDWDPQSIACVACCQQSILVPWMGVSKRFWALFLILFFTF